MKITDPSTTQVVTTALDHDYCGAYMKHFIACATHCVLGTWSCARSCKRSVSLSVMHVHQCLILNAAYGTLLALVYVNDYLVAACYISQLSVFLASISKLQDVKDLGKPDDLLGTSIVRTSSFSIVIHQSTYIRNSRS